MEPLTAEASLVPAEPETPELNLHEQSLDSLAEIIRHEHEEVTAAFSAALVHALRAGEALLEAQKRVTKGTFFIWAQAETGVSEGSISNYMRVASYRDRLLAAEPPIQHLKAAIDSLLGLPAHRPHWRAATEDVRAEAKRMHAQGKPLAHIATDLGWSPQAVASWVDPKVAARKDARRKRRDAERRALREKEKREQRDAAAKRAGGNVAEAYSLIRKLTATIDRAADQAATQNAARSLRTLNHQVFKVEDEIVRIIGEANGQA